MSNNSTAFGANVGRVGLGYGIAIAVGILVLVSTIMLASYVCVRVNGRGLSNSGGEAGFVGEAQVVGEQWPQLNTGLDQVVVESYPKIVYSSEKQLPHPQETSCAICLADYREEEVLRMLPDCKHVFHATCIDSWLRLHASCPMCRCSPLPTPLATPISTPLSELIPLARHPLQLRSSSHV